MSSSSGSKQTTAVADAIAGVVGSVISTIVFYPVDVWKTSRQTSTTATTADSYNEGEGGGCATTAETEIPTTGGIVKHDNDDIINRRLLLLLRWRDNLLSFVKLQRQSYYRGLSYKIIHIVASSFVYNYVHSLLSSEYISYCHRQRQRQRQRRQCHGRRSRRSFNETAMTEKQQQLLLLLDEGDSNDDNYYYSSHEDEKTITKTSVGIKLVLTAVAAMINSCITLPLDTISSRKQVETIVAKKQTQQQQQQTQHVQPTHPTVATTMK
jgi:heme exporter protein D